VGAIIVLPSHSVKCLEVRAETDPIALKFQKTIPRIIVYHSFNFRTWLWSPSLAKKYSKTDFSATWLMD